MPDDICSQYVKLDIWKTCPDVRSAAVLTGCGIPGADGGPLQSAIIICPGGGYGHLAPHEGLPVAGWVQSIGAVPFVLYYSHAPEYRHPQPLYDVRRAVQYLRYHHRELRIDPRRIGVLGFSAGGHAAASCCVHHGFSNPAARDELETISARPDFSVLCYPVISFGDFRHDGSMRNLLGESPADDEREFMSLELEVDGSTSPAFLWHTANDASVPVENVLLYAGALSRNDVPFEIHVFQDAPHGIGLGTAPNRVYSSVSTWRGLAETWLRDNHWLSSFADS